MFAANQKTKQNNNNKKTKRVKRRLTKEEGIVAKIDDSSAFVICMRCERKSDALNLESKKRGKIIIIIMK